MKTRRSVKTEKNGISSLILRANEPMIWDSVFCTDISCILCIPFYINMFLENYKKKTFNLVLIKNIVKHQPPLEEAEEAAKDEEAEEDFQVGDQDSKTNSNFN